VSRRRCCAIPLSRRAGSIRVLRQFTVFSAGEGRDSCGCELAEGGGLLATHETDCLRHVGGSRGAASPHPPASWRLGTLPPVQLLRSAGVGSSTRRLSPLVSHCSPRSYSGPSTSRVADPKIERTAYLIAGVAQTHPRRQGCSAMLVPLRVPEKRRSPMPGAISKQYAVQNGPMTIDTVNWRDIL
jgi:hypothetical protein